MLEVEEHVASDVAVKTVRNLTFEENTEGAISFDLVSDCSTSRESEGVVKLSKVYDNGEGISWDRCAVFFPVEPIGSDPLQACGCKAPSGPGHLSCKYKERVTRLDNDVSWKISSGGTIRAKVTMIEINVTYPPAITRFEVRNQIGKKTITIDEGTRDLVMTCSFTNGNPARLIRIFGPDNNTLNSSSKEGSGELNSRLQGPWCSHSGRYRCEADGTVHERSIQLLVKCPLELINLENDTLVVSEGQSTVLQARVQSYTAQNITCTVSKILQTPAPAAESECSRNIHSRGEPPEFWLEIALEDVSEGDNGTWRLSLANGVGESDHVNFTLNVISGQIASTTSSNKPALVSDTSTTVPDTGEARKEQSPDTGISLTMVPFGVSMLAVNGFIIVVVVVVIVVRKKRKRSNSLRNQDDSPHPDGEEMGLNVITHRQSGAHIYDEIPDEPHPVPPRCLRQRRDPIDSRPPASPPIRFANSLSTSDESSSTDDSHNNGDTNIHTLPSPVHHDGKQSKDSSEDDSHPHPTSAASTTDDQSIGCDDDDDYDDAYALSISDRGEEKPRPSARPFSRRKSQLDLSAEGDEDGRTVPPRCPKRQVRTTRLHHPAQRLTNYKCKQSRPPDEAGVRGTHLPETSIDKQTDKDGYLHPASPPSLQEQHTEKLSCDDAYLHPISSPSLQEQQTQSPGQTDADTNQLSADLQSSRHSKVFIVDDTYTHLTSPDSQQGDQSADSVGEERYQYTMLPKTKLSKAPDLRKRTGSDAYLHDISSVRENRTETQYGRSSDGLGEETDVDIHLTQKTHITNESHPAKKFHSTSKSYPTKKSHPASESHPTSKSYPTKKSHPTEESHVTNVSHPTNKSDPTNKSEASNKSV
ncbi:uncharacterized protein [Littorina saxatilis]|uniref:uncharacterized protein n=1 Tax=Littorina saxatilis TaxID=31220 RepID=UPI0038B6008E